ncbi:MAG TPA: hypothetical protein VMU12_03195, partial [Candidatus Paceibacterota bacterium]|nr:hypothetical protein [Candidatus Paceibacterota bacterium]
RLFISSSGNIQVGTGGTGTTTPGLFMLDVKSNAGDPTGANGAMYYNASTSTFRCYEGGVWKDCRHVSAESVTDTTSNQLANGSMCTATYPTTCVPASETDILDSTAPSITPDSIGVRVLITGSVEFIGVDDSDDYGILRVRRGTSGCAGTQVGPDIHGLTSDPLQDVVISFSVIDSPGTTSAQGYTLCGEANEAAAGSANPTFGNITMTIMEIGATGVDVAESYPTNETDLQPGEVVSIDPTLPNGVRRSTEAYDRNLLGVITSNPGLVLDDGTIRGSMGIVALSGRVPVKVSTENGPIKAGDFITASSIPGIGMKATKAGPVIGQALEDLDSPDSLGYVTMYVKNGYFNGDSMEGATSKPAAELLTSLVDMTPASSSLVYTDRLVAGLDIVAPTVTTHELSADTVRIGSVSIDFDDMVRNISVLASQAAELNTFELDTRAMLTDADTRIMEQLASQSAAIGTLSSRVEDVESRLASLSFAPPLNLAMLASQSSGLTFTGPITINGGLRVDSIGQSGSAVNFLADTVFFGRPYFNADTAGFAVVTAGTRSVRVTFDEPYQEAPVVNVTLAVTATASMPSYTVSETDTDGFTISLGADAVADTGFNWVALAVQSPHTFRSTPSPTPDSPTPTIPTPPPPPDVTASVSATVAPTPDLAPPASVSEPVPTPSDTPTPAPSDSPVPTDTPTP